MGLGLDFAVGLGSEGLGPVRFGSAQLGFLGSVRQVMAQLSWVRHGLVRSSWHCKAWHGQVGLGLVGRGIAQLGFPGIVRSGIVKPGTDFSVWLS